MSAALAPAGSPDDVIAQLAPLVGRMDASAVWLVVRDEDGGSLRAADPRLIAERAGEPLARVEATDFPPTSDDVRDRFAPLLDAVPGTGSVGLLPLDAGEQHLGVLGGEAELVPTPPLGLLSVLR